jgi:hypothetical protein
MRGCLTERILKQIWKESALSFTWFAFPWKNWQYLLSNSITIVCAPAEIRTWLLPNKSFLSVQRYVVVNLSNVVQLEFKIKQQIWDNLMCTTQCFHDIDSIKNNGLLLLLLLLLFTHSDSKLHLFVILCTSNEFDLSFFINKISLKGKL